MIQLSLTAEQMQGLASAAERRGQPLEEALASRFRGMAREQTKKRLRIASITRDGEAAKCEIEILADQTCAFGMIAGPLAAMASTVPGDSKVRLMIDGEEQGCVESRLEIDDGVLTIILHSGKTRPASEAAVPKRGPGRPRLIPKEA